MRSTIAAFQTKGYTLTAWAKVLDSNIHRKALLMGNSGTGDVKFAIGNDSKEGDAVTLKAGHLIKFDRVVPVEEIWATGPGVIVIGEVS